MGITVYCVGSDAAAVARALSEGSRRVSCTRLPPVVELVLRCVREKTPDLIVFGGDGARAVAVAEALIDEPAADQTPLVSWGLASEADRARLAAFGARAVDDDEDELRRVCEELLDSRDGRTVRVAGDDEKQLLHGRRVLVAEDDPAVAWYLGDTLRRAGCVVDEAHDGWEALDKARRMGPDVVLADIRMPGLDGLRLCRALRVDPVLADVPVILLSWKADWFARAKEADVGATAFLGKHAVPAEVVERVRETLLRHVALEQRFREPGPVRGLLGDLSAHRLLRLACAARPDSRLTLQSGTHGFEVHVRQGAPVSAVRVATSGEHLRGAAALGALLAARTGRFVLADDRTPVKPELAGSLYQQAADHVSFAREMGPRPVLTPSIPIVVEPTETVKVASDEPSEPSERSLPVDLVVPRVARPTATLPVRRERPVQRAWRAMVRAVAMAALAASAVVLGSDSGPRARTDAAARAAADPPPPVEGPSMPTLPGMRASHVAPPHPR